MALTTWILANPPALAEAQTTVEEVVIEEEVEVEPELTWMGLRAGTIFSPFPQAPAIAPDRRITSDRAAACLDPLGRKACGPVRGFDLQVEMFQTSRRSALPRWSVFFRTGYTAGRFAFHPEDAALGHAAGAPEALAYHTVPLFLGGNAYLFDKFPIRPYGGLGFGFDLLRLQYRRHDADPRVDISARIGFELHAGLEARFSNHVTFNVEVRQLWSARRRLERLPDYSNEGLSLIAGLAFAIPVETTQRRKVTRTTRRVAPARTAPAPAPVPMTPAPAPVIVVPAAPPAPAPVVPPATNVHVEVVQHQSAAPVVHGSPEPVIGSGPSARERAPGPTEPATEVLQPPADPPSP